MLDIDRAIANTRETIEICDTGLARDRARTYYEPAKRALVLQVRREAAVRLANLLAMRETEPKTCTSCGKPLDSRHINESD